MSSADQPYIDPSEIALEGSAAERFKTPHDAFWVGMRDAAGAPAASLMPVQNASFGLLKRWAADSSRTISLGSI